MQDLFLAVIVGLIELSQNRVAIVRVGHKTNELVRIERHLVELIRAVQVLDFIGVLGEIAELLVLGRFLIDLCFLCFLWLDLLLDLTMLLVIFRLGRGPLSGSVSPTTT